MKRLSIIVAILLISTCCSASTQIQHHLEIPSYLHSSQHSHQKHAVHQIGVASWYGKWHAGRKTANGERFNPNALTCAHKTIPLNALIRVTNTDNGRSVLCRVNDRGPYVKRRVLDASERVAKMLDYHDDGIAPVSIEIVALNLPRDIHISKR
jgi:rare lipoprotein A